MLLLLRFLRFFLKIQKWLFTFFCFASRVFSNYAPLLASNEAKLPLSFLDTERKRRATGSYLKIRSCRIPPWVARQDSGRIRSFLAWLARHRWWLCDIGLNRALHALSWTQEPSPAGRISTSSACNTSQLNPSRPHQIRYLLRARDKAVKKMSNLWLQNQHGICWYTCRH